MYKKLLTSLLLAGCISAPTYAVTFEKPIPVTVTLTTPSRGIANAIVQTKHVYLMHIKLTPAQRAAIIQYDPTQEVSAVPDIALVKLPTKALLPMTKMPVLDQGAHGTCVTFAVTAAIDALLNKGDYISQTCNLTLGKYLEDESVDFPSGWEGSLAHYVLNQMLSFGYVTKTTEAEKSCGGLTVYPLTNENEMGKPMSFTELKEVRESDLGERIAWQSVLDADQRFGSDEYDAATYDGQKTLLQVKQFLAKAAADSSKSPHGIVTFAAMLPVKICEENAGACGRTKFLNDSWVLTKAMNSIDPYRDQDDLGGHQLLIIGYDDNAIAIDENKKRHRGMLILRNSWGSEAGDHGNYYMSYEFFEKFAMEIQFIYQPKAPA